MFRLFPTIARSVAPRYLIRREAVSRITPYAGLATTPKCYQQQTPKQTPKQTPIGKVDKPMLMIAFTCKKCNHRSSHTMSKQAYTNGTVLIQCPTCHARHLIADHLKIFNDDHITIEDILKAKGESASLTTDDLAFEDIPEKLRGVLGEYAKKKDEEPGKLPSKHEGK